jgi:predicted permease
VADLSGTITSMLALLIVTVLGYIAARLGYLNNQVRPPLTKLILNVTLPCMILDSVGKMDADAGGSLIAWSFGLGALMFFIMLVGGLVCLLVLRPPKPQRHLYLYMSVFTNIGFIGIAVASSMFGGGAAFIASIFCAVTNLFFYSIGIAILCADGKGRPGIDWRQMVNMPMAASVVAMAVFFSGVTIPAPVEQALSLAGGITAPLAMMLVGLSVANSNLREMVGDWRMYGFIVLRFVLLPIGAYAGLRLLSPDPLALNVLIIMLAMPVGSLASALASAYGQDPKLPARGTILTTVASFVTIPLIVAVTAALG